jgi:hypothetical protein
LPNHPYSKLKSQDKSEYSHKDRGKHLTYISKHSNLNEPETVKQFMANLEGSDGYKKEPCITYNKYAKFYSV